MKRKTTEEFIQEAIKVHGNKYDYSEVEYIGSEIQVKIFCNKCKKYFYQSPHSHLRGRGCSYCAKNKHYTTEEFIELAKQIHGDVFDYSKIIYKGAIQKVKIHCNICNKNFEQRANSLLFGIGCPYCGGTHLKTNEEIIKKFQEVHGIKKYDYSKVNYINSRTKVIIICNKCHKEFLQYPDVHIKGSGCPNCWNSRSENKIKMWLDKNNIKYHFQKKFDDCVDQRRLPFDFYLPDYNMCIEYQGQQHYEEIFYIKLCHRSKEKAKELFQKQQYHDQIKRNYCKKNNIKLIEIRYDEDIEKRLKKEIHIIIHHKNLSKN